MAKAPQSQSNQLVKNDNVKKEKTLAEHVKIVNTRKPDKYYEATKSAFDERMQN